MKMPDHSSSSNASLLKVTPNKKNPKLRANGEIRLHKWRFHPQKGDFNVPTVATSYSLVRISSTQRFQRRICFIQYAFSHFFLIKKKNLSKRPNIFHHPWVGAVS